MNKWIRDAPTTPPKEGYWNDLVSTVYTPIVDAMINVLKGTGQLDFVSTWWDAQVLSVSSKQFPAFLIYLDNRGEQPIASKTFLNTLVMKIEYYAFHHLKRFTNELHYVAEVVETAILANRKLDGSVPCVLKATPLLIQWDWNVEGEFIIDAVIIDVEIDITKTIFGGGN